MKSNIEAALLAAAVEICEAVEAEVPVRSGDLAGSIHTGDITRSGATWSVEIGVDPSCLGGSVNYAPYVHFGTGLYGPKKQRILPKRKKALNIPGVGVRKSSEGMKPVPFFDKGMAEAEERAFEAFKDKLKIEL